MKATRIPFILAIVLASVLVVLDGGKAGAWVPWGWTWAQHNTAYDTHTMNSSWQQVADFGADQWTNVNDSDWVYTNDNTSDNDIFTGYIDGTGNILAVTTINISGGDITRATIKFDSVEAWYLGTGTPGNGQMDGRSVASHEFGHALGMNHTQNGNCPNDSGRATMCASYPIGTNYMRSLENDDETGVITLYPDVGTPTPTYTPSITPTPTITLTPSATPRLSIGGPPPVTDTPTATPAPATLTPTATPTTIPQSTSSPTPQNTATDAPTNTPQPTRTPPPNCVGC